MGSDIIQDNSCDHYQGLNMENGVNELEVLLLLCITNNPIKHISDRVSRHE
jgi:hypothetical protein